MAFNYTKYYATLFRKRGYTLINGVWYYDAEGKYQVYIINGVWYYDAEGKYQVYNTAF